MSFYKHGGWTNDKKLYQIWSGMLSRCNCETNNNYKNYGARGIKVCDQWHDFDTFRKWALENGYNRAKGRAEQSIDRIDTNGDYEPSNCRWATAKEQMNNTRQNTFETYGGKTLTLSQWAENIGLNYYTFMSRRSRGWSMGRIVNTPTRKKKGT